MQVHIVTKLAQEKTPAGVIQRVDVVVHGVFGNADTAAAIAAKYDASVTSVVLDQETRDRLQHWENPGYYQP